MSQFDPWISVVILGTVSVYATTTIVFTDWRTKIRRRMNELNNEANNIATDSLINAETVKYFANEEFVDALIFLWSVIFLLFVGSCLKEYVQFFYLSFVLAFSFAGMSLLSSPGVSVLARCLFDIRGYHLMAGTCSFCVRLGTVSYQLCKNCDVCVCTGTFVVAFV